MIQIDQFRLLSYDEQVDMLYREGIYIGKKRSGDDTILLYQLDSFYVKIFYSKYRERVQSLCVFDSTRYINEYLDHINIGEVLLLVE